MGRTLRPPQQGREPRRRAGRDAHDVHADGGARGIRERNAAAQGDSGRDSDDGSADEESAKGEDRSTVHTSLRIVCPQWLTRNTRLCVPTMVALQRERTARLG